MNEKLKRNNDYIMIDKLLHQIKDNDDDAFHQLYLLIKAPIYGYSLSILKNHDDALDNVQDVFINIYQKINNYDSKEKPMNWIFTITRNLAITKLRKMKPTVDFNSQIITSKDNNENTIWLKNLLQQLSSDEQTIIILHLLWGFKHREIAKMLDSNLSTILSKYHRSIKKIKQMEVQYE